MPGEGGPARSTPPSGPGRTWSRTGAATRHRRGCSSCGTRRAVPRRGPVHSRPHRTGARLLNARPRRSSPHRDQRAREQHLRGDPQRAGRRSPAASTRPPTRSCNPSAMPARPVSTRLVQERDVRRRPVGGEPPATFSTATMKSTPAAMAGAWNVTLDSTYARADDADHLLAVEDGPLLDDLLDRREQAEQEGVEGEDEDRAEAQPWGCVPVVEDAAVEQDHQQDAQDDRLGDERGDPLLAGEVDRQRCAG